MKYHLKSFTLLLVCALVAVMSCKNKELTPADNVNITPGDSTGGTSSGSTTFDPTTQTLVSEGKFKDGGHPTSGTVKLYRQGTTYTLVFDSFKTDEGPDLRIYLAEDTKANNFIELVELKNTGNFYLTLPDNAEVAKRKQVLIWCKRFSVLFGSAELMAPAQM
ncbi:DM13 domain-containing protein [Salmonirosea aquatica]|uniref:DM13 domain-containing protein n=1 Tax=Salmonirosea aquatica TaxID=2654236 RepID=A0A7C9BFF0_9BACT|nr:hypothetical protein [Cytophagaceae bacterium SJW1-29]